VNNKPYYVIGCIDSYGAIHHMPLCSGEEDEKTHQALWPTIAHKRWRFNIREWQLENSVLSKEDLTPEEVEDIYAFLRKHYTPPLWLIQGEEWEALGRPRSGTAYEKHCAKWEEIYKKARETRIKSIS